MTRSTIALTLTAAAVLSGCNAGSGSDTPAANAPAQAEAPRPVITGGWSAGAVSAEARAAAQFAVTAMNRPGVTLSSLDAVQQQVVAGINYRLDLTLSDSSRVRATVWKKLDGTFELTNVSPIG